MSQDRNSVFAIVISPQVDYPANCSSIRQKRGVLQQSKSYRPHGRISTFTPHCLIILCSRGVHLPGISSELSLNTLLTHYSVQLKQAS